MRGDAFIHFVSGSRRVNIRLGVLLLIPKSPHMSEVLKLGAEENRRLGCSKVLDDCESRRSGCSRC